ncbi:Rop guanine nucleotide exchange factor 1 [Morus notabilis]|uniref:Rop guanine nucleotide exchange factor 1 n=1 Tax=Morus notabilis TaxID=981085 RepID=W9S858_9ROSA|nr:Rop guanine nucleotide exchange factor 1 [Morus notabilis]
MTGIMTYDGLENCILNSRGYGNETRTRRGTDHSLDDDDALSCCSSSKDAFGSFSSKWKRDHEQELELDLDESDFCVKEKPAYSLQFSDVETMKEKFANLLLGEDVTGGCKGLTSALALSNAITTLAGTVFGELWKLEPLPEERKSKWIREMDWLLSPTNFMVELVPAKQNGANGRMLEIMTPKPRADIHMNLPALQKLDSMLIETLDSMVSTEFWYAEGGSRAEGRSKTSGAKSSKRWWLPIPQVPETGMSDSARNKLTNQGRVVYQVFKAARSINQSVLLEMPVPTIIRDALAKSGKASLSDDLFTVLTADQSSSAEEMLNSLNIKSEHNALETVNGLEAAAFSWRERIRQTQQVSGNSPVRTSWSTFMIKDPVSEHDEMELLLDRAEVLAQQLKTRYPNLPQSFLDATKIQYGKVKAKCVRRSILEAYSRALGNLAFSILCRIGDIMREDASVNPNVSSAISSSCFPAWMSITSLTNNNSDRDKLTTTTDNDRVDGRRSESTSSRASSSFDMESNSCSDAKASPFLSVNSTPSRRRVWCIGREACISLSPPNSP